MARQKIKKYSPPLIRGVGGFEFHHSRTPLVIPAAFSPRESGEGIQKHF